MNLLDIDYIKEILKMKNYVVLKDGNKVFECDNKEEATRYIVMNDYCLGLVDEKLYCNDVILYVK